VKKITLIQNFHEISIQTFSRSVVVVIEFADIVSAFKQIQLELVDMKY